MPPQALSKPIYIITDGGLLRQSGILIERVSKLLCAAKGRAAYVQLREQVSEADKEQVLPPASDAELFELTHALSPLCREFDAKLVINRRPDLYGRLPIDGVHLGRLGPGVAETRSELGKDALIGYSAHSAGEAEEAFKQGADYAFLSPIFDPASKARAAPSLGCEVLQLACEKCSGPVYALGGIGAENIGRCKKAGAEGGAAIGSFILDEAPELAVSRFLEAWDAVKS